MFSWCWHGSKVGRGPLRRHRSQWKGGIVYHKAVIVFDSRTFGIRKDRQIKSLSSIRVRDWSRQIWFMPYNYHIFITIGPALGFYCNIIRSLPTCEQEFFILFFFFDLLLCLWSVDFKLSIKIRLEWLSTSIDRKPIIRAGGTSTRIIKIWTSKPSRF